MYRNTGYLLVIGDEAVTISSSSYAGNRNQAGRLFDHSQRIVQGSIDCQLAQETSQSTM